MMLSEPERKRLSKFMSLALRHEPEKFGLTLGEQGFVSLTDLLTAVTRRREWRDYTLEHIRYVVTVCDKQRYEIAGENIRARYGHSVEKEVTYAEVEPPETLYHGTSPGAWNAIRNEGLLPMGRQYVHLSTYPEQALAVGRRHCARPILLKVKARQAHAAGVQFFQPEARLYISTAIPPEFLEPEAYA